jgi:hypothetical protein
VRTLDYNYLIDKKEVLVVGVIVVVKDILKDGDTLV